MFVRVKAFLFNPPVTFKFTNIFFTLGVNFTPVIKTSRTLFELILFPKFKCEVLYVC